MKNLMIALGMATLLSTSVSAHEEQADFAPVTRAVGAGGLIAQLELAFLHDVVLDASPLPATLLLASAATDRSTLTSGSDPWWSSGVVGPLREPTDPDSPVLPVGSPMETPWDAWENRSDLQGEWDTLDPSDR